ncbi:hypothetical protein [Streptomyces sp. NPDC026589]|uniref:hypothetical protein n=1 Tax=Streptomyces sp. NPDC026589 TaxID=3155609 RepID=UPI00340C44C1
MSRWPRALIRAGPTGFPYHLRRSGNLPPGAKTDVKTLAALAGVTRTGFYPKKDRNGTTRPGAYQHLAEEFERRIRELRDAGQIIDPQDAQIERLKKENADLKKRVAARDGSIEDLTAFRTLAVSRLAAQHEEIERLRAQVAAGAHVRALPTMAERPAPYGSRS